MNKFTYMDFYNQWLNQSSSLGGYTNQCVTLFKEFLNKAGYPNPGRAIGGTGGAREIWYRRDALGYGDYFEFTQKGQPGDWFIWDSVYGWYQGVYYGHVAMLIKDNGNGTGQFLGMNQTYNLAPAQVQTLKYDGSCGVLHYKGYIQPSSYDASKLINEHAIATMTYDVNKRVGTPNGSIAGTATTGTKIEYTQKWVGNGHRYISWVENGTRYFVAVSGSEQQGVDPWATFAPISSPTLDLIQEDGLATMTVDGVRARLNSPTGDVVRTYNTGDKIKYTHKYIGNGHRYIVWTEGDDKIFLAVAGTEDRSDMWATFGTDEEPKQDTPSEEPKSETQNPEYIKNVKGYGVDISEHNGASFDITPYDFVIIRAAWGENTDQLFEANVKKCEEAGKPYGVYLYDYALDDDGAKAEAEYMLKLIEGKNIQLGVWFDMEDADHYKQKKGVLTAERCSNSCKIFCDALKAKGYFAGVYSSSSWFGKYINTDYPKWIAQWKNTTEFIYEDLSNECDVFQYTSMNGKLDRDVIYKDISYFASNPIKDEPVEPEPTPEPNEPSTPEEPKNDKPSEEPAEEPKEDNEDDKPTDKPNDNKTEQTNGISTLINLLIELVKKILNIFK